MTQPHAQKRYLEQVTRKELVELMQESKEDSLFSKHLAEAEGLQIPVEEPESGSDSSPDEVIMLEELVYPYDLTHSLLQRYHRTYFVAEFDMKLIFRKLYRSCRYWRIKAPAWLREVIR